MGSKVNNITIEVLTFRTRAWLACVAYMPDATWAVQDIPHDPSLSYDSSMRWLV
jgi:hypothetical protein